jgi:hypothetical protein
VRVFWLSFLHTLTSPPVKPDLFYFIHIKFTGADFLMSLPEEVLLAESSSDDEDSTTASNASSDCDIVKKGPKKRVKARAKDSNDKGKASPMKKKKGAGASSGEDNKEVDGDGEKKVNEAKVKWPTSKGSQEQLCFTNVCGFLILKDRYST